MATLDSVDLAPSLIKIHAEGLEPHVLRGARETLGRFLLILFEALSDEKLEECRAQILRADTNYKLRRVSAFNLLAMPSSAQK